MAESASRPQKEHAFSAIDILRSIKMVKNNIFKTFSVLITTNLAFKRLRIKFEDASLNFFSLIQLIN